MDKNLNLKLLDYINNNYGNIAFMDDDEIKIIREKEQIRFHITSTENTYLENKCEYGIHLDYDNKKDWCGSGSYEIYNDNNIVDIFLKKYRFSKQESQFTIFDFIGD